MTNLANDMHKRFLTEDEIKLRETDPEFSEFFYNFVSNEVNTQTNLDEKTKYIVLLASLIGCQGIDEYKIMLNEALKSRLSPIEIKEIVYQSVAYLGIGRVRPFLTLTNDVFIQMGIKLPLENQSTTSPENRLEKGIDAMVSISGENMREFHQKAPEETLHINQWLTKNCFGDYYTRNGLDYRQREIITFCLLMAQGGCESQLIYHSTANMRIGNNKQFLINVVSQCIPYIGYPRALNALKCINDAEMSTK